MKLKPYFWMLFLLLSGCTPTQPGEPELTEGIQDSIQVENDAVLTENLSVPVLEQNFSWLGLDMGMDSAAAAWQIHMLNISGCLGDFKSQEEKDGSFTTGYEYHLRGAGLDAKAIWVTHFYQGKLGMVDLHLYEGVTDKDQLYEFLERIYGPTGIHKDGSHIWYKGNSEMRATNPDYLGRHHIYWADRGYHEYLWDLEREEEFSGGG